MFKFFNFLFLTIKPGGIFVSKIVDFFVFMYDIIASALYR